MHCMVRSFMEILDVFISYFKRETDQQFWMPLVANYKFNECNIIMVSFLMAMWQGPIS